VASRVADISRQGLELRATGHFGATRGTAGLLQLKLCFISNSPENLTHIVRLDLNKPRSRMKLLVLRKSAEHATAIR
jgi:hypothetical protein